MSHLPLYDYFLNNAGHTLPTESFDTMFKLQDVLDILGLKESVWHYTELLDSNDQDVLIGNDPANFSGQGDDGLVPYVTESGLYRLVFMSDCWLAKEFKHWVKNKVVPQVLETGRYDMPNKTL